ncbi:MAG: hypothetical protein FWF51_08010 [Chitinivibrionia bacterium]|nr:hypothetical protein [Chitinivibrionia bacterium]
MDGDNRCCIQFLCYKDYRNKICQYFVDDDGSGTCAHSLWDIGADARPYCECEEAHEDALKSIMGQK